MTFGHIPKPTSLDWRWNDTATVTTREWTQGDSGSYTPGTSTTALLVPCRLDPASSDEVIRYGKATDSVLYTLRLPMFDPSGGLVTVDGERQVTVAGVTYSVVGGPQQFTEHGYQTVPVVPEAR